ncbi:MAG: helix-turn-helix domain-containing protein [Sandaracinaceae bacterium]
MTDEPDFEALLTEHLRRIGERIAELRAMQGLHLAELEEYSGVGLTHLSRIEHGQKNISMSTALRIADALGVQLHELFVPPEISQIRARKRPTKKSAKSPKQRSNKAG